MRTVTGIVGEVYSLVDNGNTVHFFTLLKARARNLGSSDQVYTTVFIQSPPARFSEGTREPWPSKLALQLASLRQGAEIEVTISNDQEPPVGYAVDYNNRFYVTAIQPVARNPLGIEPIGQNRPAV